MSASELGTIIAIWPKSVVENAAITQATAVSKYGFLRSISLTPNTEYILNAYVQQPNPLARDWQSIKRQLGRFVLDWVTLPFSVKGGRAVGAGKRVDTLQQVRRGQPLMVRESGNRQPVLRRRLQYSSDQRRPTTRRRRSLESQTSVAYFHP